MPLLFKQSYMLLFPLFESIVHITLALATVLKLMTIILDNCNINIKKLIYALFSSKKRTSFYLKNANILCKTKQVS